MKGYSSVRVATVLAILAALWFFRTPANDASRIAAVLAPDYSGTEREQELIKWVLQQGGTVNARAGKACRTCLRGLIADRDINPAGLIVRIPPNALLKLPELNHTGFAAEYARGLLRSVHQDRLFNATWAPYLATLPPPSDLFPPEMWEPRHVAMLQTPALETLAEYSRLSTEQIFNGLYPEHPYPPFAVELQSGPGTVAAAPAALDLATFKYASGLVATRFFGIPMDNSDKLVHVLAPVMEFCNHADGPLYGASDDVDGQPAAALNAFQSSDNGSLTLRALLPIKKGEEIRFNYQPGVVHRPDMSLVVYGFFQKRKYPLLCAVDLPTFNIYEQYNPTSETDDAFYGPKGRFNTEEELQRLGHLLGGAATTLQEDEAAVLAMKTAERKNGAGDWREMLLEFRVERKRALVAAINKIQRELDKQHSRAKGSDQGREL